MPGELGNEEESQSPGYREHLYEETGEWMLADPNKERPLDEKKPRSSMVSRVLRIYNKDKEPT